MYNIKIHHQNTFIRRKKHVMKKDNGIAFSISDGNQDDKFTFGGIKNVIQLLELNFEDEQNLV